MSICGHMKNFQWLNRTTKYGVPLWTEILLSIVLDMQYVDRTDIIMCVLLRHNSHYIEWARSHLPNNTNDSAHFG